jgi:antirestriction protein
MLPRRNNGEIDQTARHIIYLTAKKTGINKKNLAKANGLGLFVILPRFKAPARAVPGSQKKRQKMNTTTTARIYVGTYAKYNAGSIQGAWLDLNDYADAGEFHAACLELHKDEEDPELMFQDFEGIPAGMVSECSIDADVWEWLALDEDAQELLAVYRENISDEGTIDDARDCYQGQYESAAAWAENYLSETGSLAEIPEGLRYYFDFAAYARDAGITFVRYAGNVWAFN